MQPPQRKGKLPLYGRGRLVELQEKFDELEEMGVFKKPEDIGIVVEYLNPSFLVNKPSGGSRLVTAFGDVAKYSKPQPSLLPDIDSTLRTIGSWTYIIETDLTKAFHQIPLSRESQKYCCVATPYKGIRVYVRAAMGLPGSETALEEIMCRVLGDELQKGSVAKIADNLYCGADSIEELYQIWERVVIKMDKANLQFSAPKTVICPTASVILGWKWVNGTLSPTNHRISTLSTCSKPSNVKGMRSFLGAFKVLGRVIQNHTKFLGPLEEVCGSSKDSKDQIQWTDDLHKAFTDAQNHLKSWKSITIPRSGEQLFIVTDGSVRECGLGSTLYVMRDSKPLLAGFFSAKMRCHQIRWLPCEVEALSIGTSIKHFAPYIIQSGLKPILLTDSKPCVESFQLLCKGEFSTSPRVSTFLAIASRYQVLIQHLAGKANVPSDFASRNALPCTDPNHCLCSFITDISESVTRNIAVSDVLNGSIKLPFISRVAWIETQKDCPDIRRAVSHLRQGTRPSKKETSINDVKRYLNVASVARDGLLIVPFDEPLVPHL